jgi:hypothetical protein
VCGIEFEGTSGEVFMETQKPNPKQDPAQATEHVASAHQALKTLQEKIGKHPELGDAIRRLEMALSILTVETGGML